MIHFNKLAIAVAAAALASVSGAQVIDNWKSASGDVWKNVDGQCWRDASWTPATAAPGCGGAQVVVVAAPAPAPAPVVVPAPVPVPAPAPAPAPVVVAPAPVVAVPVPEPVAVPAPAPKAVPAPAPAPTVTKVTYAADAYFDNGISALKPEGKAKLDELVAKIKGINLEVIIAVGHTDTVGRTGNDKISIARAENVKAYLVSKGIEKNRVYTEGKGGTQPVADNSTAEGRAKNRRVEIEVVGTRTVQ